MAFWDHERRQYAPRQSGSELIVSLRPHARHWPQTAHTRAAAEEAAQIAIGTCGHLGSHDSFASYLADFWKADGAYAQALTACGHPLSAEHLLGNRDGMERQVLPYLRKQGLERLELGRVTAGHLGKLIPHLHGESGSSSRRINSVRQAIARALAEAECLRKIPAIPARRIPQLAEIKPERSILTSKEAALVLARMPSGKIRLLNILAATTGMCLGGCLGLQVQDLGTGSELTVRHNWQPTEGDKPPKAGSVRIVLVPRA